jgi:multiple sugar transport system ATP-binding protein
MDQRVRAEIRARIRHLHNEMGNTTIYVTHDQAEAVSLCDRMVILHKAELQQIGTVEEIWNRPANRFVAFFVGEPAMNFIDGRIESARSVFIPAAGRKHAFRFEGDIGSKYAGDGMPITIGIRPQQIKVSRAKKEDNSIPGSVKIMEFQGETTVLTIKINDEKGSEIKAVVPAMERYGSDDKVWLHFDPAFIHLFDGDAPIIRRKGK